jgi:pimeloyl-ACP methyl ester carboxylesterase
MLPAEIQHAEGARYRATLVLVPALWAGPASWRAFATYLGHRGWESHLVDVRRVEGFDARAAAVADYAARLASPAVLLGHDVGAAVALSAAGRVRVAALVLVAPVLPGTAAARRGALAPRDVFRVALGRPVPPPEGPPAALRLGELPAAVRAQVAATFAAEPGAVVRAVVRRRAALLPVGAPTLVVGGARDPLLSSGDAAALAAALGAEQRTLEDAAHWPLAGAGWAEAVGAVHRWIVGALGEPLLEHHAEAMAERDDDDPSA